MLVAIFLIAVLLEGRACASTVTATCETGVKVTLSISDATAGHKVYTLNVGCGNSTISGSPTTFIVDGTISGCTVNYNVPFYLVIQAAGFLSFLDEVLKVTCATGNSPSVETSTVATALGAPTGSVSATFTTTVTFVVVDQFGDTLSTVAVGDPVKLKVSIPSVDNAHIGFSITTVTFTVVGGTSVEVITSGCKANNAPIDQPQNEDTSDDGIILVPFNMFFPITSGSRPLPGSTASVQIEVEVTLCNGNCAALNCGSGRKRRTADVPALTDVLTLTRPLVVLPPGMSAVPHNQIHSKNGMPIAREVNSLNTTLIGTAVALGSVIALCIVVLVFMVCRLRRNMNGNDSKQSAFEQKADSKLVFALN